MKKVLLIFIFLFMGISFLFMNDSSLCLLTSAEVSTRDSVKFRPKFRTRYHIKMPTNKPLNIHVEIGNDNIYLCSTQQYDDFTLAKFFNDQVIHISNIGSVKDKSRAFRFVPSEIETYEMTLSNNKELNLKEDYVVE